MKGRCCAMAHWKLKMHSPRVHFEIVMGWVQKLVTNSCRRAVLWGCTQSGYKIDTIFIHESIKNFAGNGIYPCAACYQSHDISVSVSECGGRWMMMMV